MGLERQNAMQWNSAMDENYNENYDLILKMSSIYLFWTPIISQSQY